MGFFSGFQLFQLLAVSVLDIHVVPATDHLRRSDDDTCDAPPSETWPVCTASHQRCCRSTAHGSSRDSSQSRAGTKRHAAGSTPPHRNLAARHSTLVAAPPAARHRTATSPSGTRDVTERRCNSIDCRPPFRTVQHDRIHHQLNPLSRTCHGAGLGSWGVARTQPDVDVCTQSKVTIPCIGNVSCTGSMHAEGVGGEFDGR